MHLLPSPGFDHVRPPDPRRLTLIAVGGVASLVLSTFATLAVERTYGVRNAGSIYQLAVVAMALGFGTPAAVATAIAAFFLYDVLFIQPLYTITVADPAEWMTLVLLLVVGIVVGRLAGSEHERADAAVRQEHEARALFRVGRILAERRETADALHAVTEVLATDTRMARVWIGLGRADSEEVAADTGTGPHPDLRRIFRVLRQSPGEGPVDWVRIHGWSGRLVGVRRPMRRGLSIFRVPIEAGGQPLGSIWATRQPKLGAPSAEETRVLASAAGQVGQALERDRLAAAALSAEVARRSDELKSALLDSVSHDLRTPLASIRAAAGSLMDPQLQWAPHEQRGLAAAIDREADRLNRLVTNMLDVSRIEGGGLAVELEPFSIRDVVLDAIERRRAVLRNRPVTVEIPDSLPFVRVDGLLIEQVLANILENAAHHTPDGTPVRVRAEAALGGETALGGERVRVTIEDAGPGVPDEALEHLFEKFFRVPKVRESARRGTGVGLAVVRGLVDAMGGSVHAERSELGGLAFVIDLQVAPAPDERARDNSPESVGPGEADAGWPGEVSTVHAAAATE